MNRELKFRAYIKNNERVPSETSKIVDVKSLHLASKKAIIGYSQSKTSYGNYSVPFEDLELMQSTGLKDINGVEIYEGDIVQVKYFEDSTSKKYVVKYDTDRAGFFPFACGDGCGCCETDVISVEYTQILGNIYDNPELLEKERS